MKNKHLTVLCSLSIIVVLVAGHLGPKISAADFHSGEDSAPSQIALQVLSAEPETREFRRGYQGYDGVQDTYLQRESTSPYGGEQMIHVRERADDTKRTLMRFDLTEIPHYMEVTEAILDLSLGHYRYPETAAPVSLYYLLKPWDEAVATWNTTGFEDWSVAGAGGAGSDYEAQPFATTTFPVFTGYYSIDVTDAVQHWVQDPSSNYGFMIKGNSSVDARAWASDGTRDSERPRLIVTFEIPPDVTPEPTYTPTFTLTPTLEPSATPTPANIVSSIGVAEAFPPDDYYRRDHGCIEAGPLTNNPDNMDIFLVWQGTATMAKLSFKYANNNRRANSVLVNGQIIGQLPGENWQSVCTGGTYAELEFDPALVSKDSAKNTISILDDVPGETNSWSLQEPQIHLGGYVQASDIQVVEITSSYDSTLQRAMIQKPIGMAPDLPLPLVIALHGWGGRDYDAFTWFAKACSDRGWLLACSDTRNNNQHTASEQVQHDVIDLIHYMQDNPEYLVDPERIYLTGTSMGGMMAATIAAKYPDYFAALAVLRAPTRLDTWYREIEAWRQDVIAAEINGTPYTNPFDYQRRSAAAMPMNLRNIPTIIIHGLNDTLVPYYHAEDLKAGMEAYGAQHVALYPYEGGHEDDHPEWGAENILGFFNEYSLNTCPLTVTVRTDEPKSYYWMDIGYVTSDHWTQANAWFDRDTQTITVDVFDERTSPVSVDVTLDLGWMGLPTGVSYTVEDANISTGEFSQYTVQAGARHLTLNVPRDHHRLVAYPFAAPAPRAMTLRQGEGGYAGVDDTYIEEFVPGANHAEDDALRITSGQRFPLFRFDLSPEESNLPPDSVIKGAQLRLYTTKWDPEYNVKTSVYRLLKEWDVNQATWIERVAGAAWTEAGAMGEDEDHDATVYASQWLNDAPAWYNYNVTDLVRQWVADGERNYGLLIHGYDGRGTLTLSSSESPSNKPELVIYYTEATATPTPTNTPIPTPTLLPSPSPGSRGVYLPAILKP